MQVSEKLLNPDGVEQEVFDFGQYRVACFIKKNLEKSQENEDSLFFYGENGHFICGVSDGVGGHSKGKEASLIASEGMIKYFKKISFENPQVLTTLENINLKIRELKVGARTTQTCGLLQNHNLRLFTIGDSEAILVNTKGDLVFSNIPQSPVGYGVESGMLDKEEALDDPDRHIVNHLLGDETLRFEASSRIPFKKGYSLLVGSDGIFDNVNHHELLNIIGGGSYEESFAQLVALCDKSSPSWRKDDDISFLFIRRVRSE